MTSEELRYFFITVECRSISAAADRLFITRQGLSKSLRRMEQRLGAPLLDRSSGGIELTDFGRYFFDEAEAAWLRLTRLDDIYERYQQHASRTLRLSLLSERSPSHKPVAAALERLKELYPDLKIEMFSPSFSQDISSRLKLNRDVLLYVDGNGSNSLDKTKYVTVPLEQLEFHVAVSPRHHLAAMEAITMDALKNESIAVRHPGDYISEWLISTGFPREQILYTQNNFDIRNRLLENGEVLIIRSRFTSRGLYNDDTISISFSPPSIARLVMLTTPEILEAKPVVQDFFRLLREIVGAEK